MMGLGRPYLLVAMLYNFLVLAGLLYAFAKHEAEFSNVLYVYFGMFFGQMLFSLLLTPFMHSFVVLPIILLNILLLCRFCLVRWRRAMTVAALFQAGQAIFLVGYLWIRSKLV